MLNAIADCPQNIGENISPSFWIASLLSNLLVIGLLFAIFRWIYQVLSVQYGLNPLSIFFWVFGVSSLITLALYVYYVYLVDAGSSRKGTQCLFFSSYIL